MSVFDKWNKNVDVEGLRRDTKEAEKSGRSGEFTEVPVGKYEVMIDKMELKESSKGNPMFSCWFKILEGKYKNNRIFMNQVITQGFQIGIVNTFLRDLDVLEDDQIEFIDYSQYNDLIMDIKEAVDNESLGFILDYSKNAKDYSVFKITEVFDR